MKTRKIPMRTCLGCRQAKPKKEMLRIVRNRDGEISVDPTGKAAGRGAYVCRDPECFKQIRAKHGLEKSFSCAVSSEIYDRLESELSE